MTNELHEYIVDSNAWTLVESDADFLSDASTYDNTRPSPRIGHCMISNPANNSFFIIGGAGATSIGNGIKRTFNDVWEYNIGSKTWTQLYATTAESGPFNTTTPQTRMGAACAADGSGHIYLFGGMSYTSTPSDGTFSGLFNDVWMFNISTKSWTKLYGEFNAFFLINNSSPLFKLTLII